MARLHKLSLVVNKKKVTATLLQASPWIGGKAMNDSNSHSGERSEPFK